MSELVAVRISSTFLPAGKRSTKLTVSWSDNNISDPNVHKDSIGLWIPEAVINWEFTQRPFTVINGEDSEMRQMERGRMGEKNRDLLFWLDAYWYVTYATRSIKYGYPNANFSHGNQVYMTKFPFPVVLNKSTI